MPHVACVATLEIGHPMLLFVLMKTDDGAIHWIECLVFTLVSGPFFPRPKAGEKCRLVLLLPRIPGPCANPYWLLRILDHNFQLMP
jgi:hypothetical protein